MKRLLLFFVAFALLINSAAATTTLINSYRHAGGVDVTAPTVSSVTVTGTAVTIVFSEAVTRGAGWNNGDLDIDGATANNTFTYVSGDGTSTWTGTLGTPAVAAETLNYDFNGDANSIEDAAGNDLASVTNGSVTNSTSGGSDIAADMHQTFEDTVDNLGTTDNTPTGSWAKNDGNSALSTSTSGQQTDLHTVNSVSPGGSNGFSIDTSLGGAAANVVYDYGSSLGTAPVSHGGWVTFPDTLDSETTYEIFHGAGGENVCRVRLYDDGDGFKFGLRGNGGWVNYGTATAAGKYYVTVYTQAGSNSCKLLVYDSSGVVIGTEVTATAADSSLRYFIYGSESALHTGTGVIYLDNWKANYTTAPWPYAP